MTDMTKFRYIRIKLKLIANYSLSKEVETESKK